MSHGHVCTLDYPYGIFTTGMASSFLYKTELPYSAVSYVCGCCGNHFTAICGLHEHLLKHEAGGSYHYDHLLRTAFPKYDTQCNSTQTVHGSERKQIMRLLGKFSNNIKPDITKKNKNNSTTADRSTDSLDFHNEVGIAVNEDDEIMINVKLKQTTDEEIVPCLKNCRVLLSRMTEGDVKKWPANGSEATYENCKEHLTDTLGSANVDVIEPTTDIMFDTDFKETVDEFYNEYDEKQKFEIGEYLKVDDETESTISIETKETNVSIADVNTRHSISNRDTKVSQSDCTNKSAIQSVRIKDEENKCVTINEVQTRRSKRKNTQFTYEDNEHDWDTLEPTDDHAKHLNSKKIIKKVPKRFDSDSDWDYLEEIHIKDNQRKKQKTKKDVATSKQENIGIQNTTDKGIFEPCGDDEKGAKMIKKKNVKNRIVCYICGASIKKEASVYKEHIAHHTGDATIPCTRCDKKFTTQRQLRRHMTWHTEHKAFQCEICAVQCSSLFILKTHTYIHTGENPFKCTYCQMAFKTSGKRLRHMNNIHLGIRHHKCPTCNRDFKDRSCLTEHILTHTPGSFACRFCGRKFNSKRSKHRHEWIHNSEKPIQCHVCGHSFIQRYPYWTHMEKKHGLCKDEVKVILEARKQEEEACSINNEEMKG